MKICVFLGPTMPVADARAILPDAVYLPPASQADVVSAMTIHRPDAIALIDGVFGQSLSVWHKEILYALHCGIAVFGASSMGALRAVECAPFGMIGVGEVVRAYAEGRITGDDEVALAHAGPEDGFLPLSEPLVNLRASFAAAEASGAIDAALHRRLLVAAKDLFFPERTRDRIWDAAGLTEAERRQVEGALAAGYVDIKRQDAEGLLAHLRDRAEPPPRVPFSFAGSLFFDVLYDRDRKVSHGGHAVPLADVANHAALHRPDFADINNAALARAALVQLAPLVGVTVDADAVAAETRRLCRRHGLAGPDDVAAWCRRNDLSDAEFAQLMAECAVERAMRRWIIARRYLTRTTRPVLDELRLRGLYETVAADAAVVARADEVHFGDHTHRVPDALDALLDDHLANTGARVDAPCDEWAYESGFRDVQDLRLDLARAARVRALFRRLAAEAGTVLSEEEPAR